MISIKAETWACKGCAIAGVFFRASISRRDVPEQLRLLRRFFKAAEGEGQAALLSGEAGIGKSRLTSAFVGRLAGEPHIRLRFSCSPQHTDSALYPFIGQIERAAGLAREDTARAKLDKLDGLLNQTSTSVQDAALFAGMLSLSNDGRYPSGSAEKAGRRPARTRSG